MVKIDENEDFVVWPDTSSSEHFVEIPYTQIVEMRSYYTAMNLTYREQMTLIKFSFSEKATKICAIILIGFDIYLVKFIYSEKATKFCEIFP